MAEEEISPISSSDSEERDVGADTLLPPKHGLEIYVVTAVAVIQAYASLLMININYMKVVAIPVIILVFIAALCRKFYVKGRMQYGCDGISNMENGTEDSERLLVTVLLSYWLLASCVRCNNGQENDSFVISHFLLFFSSALGALAVMMTILPIGTAPGVAQVLDVLHKTFTAILFITVHVVTAEWTGEDMVLVCMPELIAALVWFTTHFDHGGCTVSVDKFTSHKSSVMILSAAMILLAYLTSKFAYERNVLAYWYTRVMCSCALSGVLSYFSVWMVHVWPGSTDSAEVSIQILKYSANMCFTISVILLPIQVSVRFCLTMSAKRLPAALMMLGQRVLDKPAIILDLAGICLALYILVKYRIFISGTLRTIKLQANHMGRIKFRSKTTFFMFILVMMFFLLLIMQALVHDVLVYYLEMKTCPSD